MTTYEQAMSHAERREQVKENMRMELAVAEMRRALYRNLGVTDFRDEGSGVDAVAALAFLTGRVAAETYPTDPGKAKDLLRRAAAEAWAMAKTSGTLSQAMRAAPMVMELEERV